MSFVRYIAAFVALLCLPLAMPAAAVELSQADQDAVAQYRLNEDVLHRVEAVARDMAAGNLTVEPDGPVDSINDMADAMARNSAIKQCLDRNQLTPREFVLAVGAIFMAVEKSRNSEEAYDTNQPLESLPADEANMRFYDRHKDEIDTMLRLGQG